MITTIFPEHKWLPWKFANTPKSFWDLLNNQRKFLDWVGSELGVKNLEDWYKIRVKVKFSTLNFFQLEKILKEKYRTYMILEAVRLFILIMEVLFLKCWKLYILNLSGCHGNLRIPQNNIGQTQKMC
jgi:hypothetical protein